MVATEENMEATLPAFSALGTEVKPKCVCVSSLLLGDVERALNVWDRTTVFERARHRELAKPRETLLKRRDITEVFF